MYLPRRHALATLVLLVAATACGDATSTPLTPETAPDWSAHASGAPAASSDAPGAPEPIPFSNTFTDLDPCTEEPHTVTISGTLWLHQLPNGKQVMRQERTITTDTGYEGTGVRTVVDNGNVFHLTNNDVVSHPDGRKFRAHGLQVVDMRTDPPTMRVQKGGFTCVGS